MSEGEAASGTVVRVAILLRTLAEAGGDITLSEIAERMKLPVSTTHRLLNLLSAEGFVDRGSKTRSYRAGLEFLRLGGLVTSRSEVSDTAQGFMQAVVDACHETCMLSLYMPQTGTSMITRVVYGVHPLRYEATMYQPTSLTWGATGRGILAFLPEETIEAILARKELSPATGKAAKLSEIRPELEQIRARGYAYTHSQKIAGAVGLSAPVRGPKGVVGALCVTIPEFRFEDATAAEVGELLVTQANRLSLAIGMRPE